MTRSVLQAAGHGCDALHCTAPDMGKGRQAVVHNCNVPVGVAALCNRPDRAVAVLELRVLQLMGHSCLHVALSCW